ncbi:hypothetical protein V6N11_060688 [Hibiscus sabdariffa]|uniref:Uncharacterized protein n=1 Tax=Hibiscus sabdariffa TaxID=183260 RepID=A0ABR2QR19_9ROSI
MQSSSMVVGSSLKPPPPPPSPQRALAWDFLNPFESFESYYPLDKKLFDSDGYSKFPIENVNGKVTTSEPEASLYQAMSNVRIENDMVEYEVHVVDKKVVEKKPWRGRRNPSSSVGLGMVKATQNG